MDSFRLRLFQDNDFEAFHAIVSDFDVVKMLGSWPFPSEPEFTRKRMNTPEAKAGLVLVIEVNGEFAGTIGGVKGEVGYMLGRKFWGRGVATKAVAAITDMIFETTEHQVASACVWHGNPASEHVLRKNGYVKTGSCKEINKARGKELIYDSFTLDRAQWVARRA